MNFEVFLTEFQRAKNWRQAFVVVTLVDAKGSAPQEIGSRLIVNTEGYFAGTVGGGKLEKAAIEKSMAMLENKTMTQLLEINLQTDLGMSCGGQVRLFFEAHNPATEWKIAIFGAGHVA